MSFSRLYRLITYSPNITRYKLIACKCNYNFSLKANDVSVRLYSLPTQFRQKEETTHPAQSEVAPDVYSSFSNFDKKLPLESSPAVIKDAKKATSGSDPNNDEDNKKPEEKLGLFKKFKKMYKEYWYVMVPVHLATSAMWFGGFYYISASGVDIPTTLEMMGLSETYINPIRNSKLGHVAVAYLLYKIVTPVRYAVTLGGTTVSIKYLVARGYIKPVPTKQELIQKYKDRQQQKRSSS